MRLSSHLTFREVASRVWWPGESMNELTRTCLFLFCIISRRMKHKEKITELWQSVNRTRKQKEKLIKSSSTDGGKEAMDGRGGRGWASSRRCKEEEEEAEEEAGADEAEEELSSVSSFKTFCSCCCFCICSCFITKEGSWANLFIIASNVELREIWTAFSGAGGAAGAQAEEAIDDGQGESAPSFSRLVDVVADAIVLESADHRG